MFIRFLALPAALVIALAAHAGEPPKSTSETPVSVAEAQARIGSEVAAMDGNSDGFISADELRSEHERRQAEHAQKRLDAMDTDADGKVSVAEFTAARSSRLEAHDRDGDGMISADESHHGKHGKRGGHRPDGNGTTPSDKPHH